MELCGPLSFYWKEPPGYSPFVSCLRKIESHTGLERHEGGPIMPEFIGSYGMAEKWECTDGTDAGSCTDDFA